MTIGINYIRTKGSDTWHWRADCSHYPTVAATDAATQRYRGKKAVPSYGELCDECLSKDGRRPGG